MKEKQLRCCANDGGWPTELGMQALGSNQFVLLQSKAVVVSDERNGSHVMRPWYVIERRAKANLPMTHRNIADVVKTRIGGCVLGEAWKLPVLLAKRQPVQRRRDSITGVGTKQGNLTIDAKGKDKRVKP